MITGALSVTVAVFAGRGVVCSVVGVSWGVACVVGCCCVGCCGVVVVVEMG